MTAANMTDAEHRPHGCNSSSPRKSASIRRSSLATWARVGGASCRSAAALSPGRSCAARFCTGGADWQVLRTDGVAELEARYTLRTDDGALIYVRNHALRHGTPEAMAALAQGRRADPASYYFRGATFFETSAARYAWLGKTIVICSGEREPAGVNIKFFQVL